MGTGEKMKTIVLTESQLKEFLKTGKITTPEPVKKGEEMIHDPPQEIFNSKGETICKVGEVVPVVNEKGNSMCKNCFALQEIVQKKNLMDILKWWHYETFSTGSRHCVKTGCQNPEPLLVRLNKIEKKKYDNEEFWFKTLEITK